MTCLAMTAFAANSVLCRFALGQDSIDPTAFTAVRLLSGALVLSAIFVCRTGRKTSSGRGSWLAAAMLFLYAISFSFAYVSLTTGTGALILFGAVQITMIVLTLISGEQLRLAEWLGLTMAFGGLVYLVLPGVTAPSLSGFLLMALAGGAWGVYTLRGRGSKNPLADTAFNFIRSVPLVIIPVLAAFPKMQVTNEGILLAALSGGVTSGIGYAIWYTALRGLTATLAAVVQLSVPIIAATGGVIVMSEQITLRLILSAFLTLGGILIVILGKPKN